MDDDSMPGALGSNEGLGALLPTRIWAVGTVLDEKNWMAESLHWKESDAATAAKPGQFIVLCPIGQDFPADATDAEKLYYPNEEQWEQSALYRMRHAPNGGGKRAAPGQGA